MTEPKPGVYIYDFKQNMAGVESLRVTGPAGTDVQVRPGEALNPDGTLYTENLRTAKATDHFILAGQGTEVLVPHFTFHGFRYIEVTGLKSAPEPGAVSALVLHTDFPFTAKLTDRQCDGEQAVEQHSVGAAIEFCGAADGLSAAR